MHTLCSIVQRRKLLCHLDWLRTLARSLVRGEQDAEDIAQEATAIALARPPAHRGALRVWLTRVLTNLARQCHRSEKARRARERAVPVGDAPDDPADLCARAEQQRRLAGMVLELREPYRTAILLRYFEGLPPVEIAGRLGVPASTVRTRISRGLGLLRGKLDVEFGGGRHLWGPLLLPLADSDLVTRSAGTSAAGAVGETLIVAAKTKALIVIIVVVSAVLFAVRTTVISERLRAATEAVKVEAPPEHEAELSTVRDRKEALERHLAELRAGSGTGAGTAFRMEPWAAAVFLRGGLREKLSALLLITDERQRVRGRRELAEILRSAGQASALRILQFLETEEDPALLSEMGQVILRGAIHRAAGEVKERLPEIAGRGDLPERRLAALRAMISISVSYPVSSIEAILRDQEDSPRVLAGALEAVSVWRALVSDVPWVESLAARSPDPDVRRAAARVLVRQYPVYPLARVLDRIEELNTELAAFAREGPEPPEGVLPGEEIEPWARIVYSNLCLAEKLLGIYRDLGEQSLAVAWMQLAKEVSRRPEVADQLLALLEPDEPPEVLHAAVRFATGRPIDNPTREQVVRLLALSRSPQAERRLAAYSMLMGPARPAIENPKVLATLEGETDPGILALAFERIYCQWGGLPARPEFWRGRLEVLSGEGETADLRRWAKSLLLLQFLSLSDLLSAMHVEVRDDRREEWAQALLMAGSRGILFLPAQRGMPPDGMDAALLEALRLIPSAQTRRSLLVQAADEVEGVADFYHEAALAEPDPDLRRDLDALAADLREAGEKPGHPGAVVKKHLRPH